MKKQIATRNARLRSRVLITMVRYELHPRPDVTSSSEHSQPRHDFLNLSDLIIIREKSDAGTFACILHDASHQMSHSEELNVTTSTSAPRTDVATRSSDSCKYHWLHASRRQME